MLNFGQISIGDHTPPVIIAEIGINHGGNLDVAKKMAELAVLNGASIIKHQTHIPSEEMSKAEASVIKPKGIDRSIWEIISECALDLDSEMKLKEFVEEIGGIYVSTPFSIPAFEFLQSINVVGFKIGSGESSNLHFLNRVASARKPMIVSTGMLSIEEVDKIYNFLKKLGSKFCLLHTTNLYPTPDHLVRLGSITQMMNRYNDVNIGLSDHTIGNLACLAAVGLGANLLERHFTDRMDRIGPDIANSMDPNELRDLARDSKRVWEMRAGEKSSISEEQPTRDFAFGSLVTVKALSSGEIFSEENISIKRPGTGDFGPDHYDKIIGKTAAKNIAADVLLKKSDVSF